MRMHQSEDKKHREEIDQGLLARQRGLSGYIADSAPQVVIPNGCPDPLPLADY